MAFPTDLPEDMDDLLYFTNRKWTDGTKIIAWVARRECPECGKGLMGKPINEKTGKPKIRSPIYVCPECDFEQKKDEHMGGAEIQIRYSNPEGTEWKSATTDYTYRSWQGMKSFVFYNEFWGDKMGITKRLKMGKNDGDDE